MNHARLYALPLALLAVALVIAVAGCGAKPFSIAERSVCGGIDASGSPTDVRDVFTTADTAVFVWFKATGAQPGQVVKAKFKYVDEAGAEETEEVQTELKGGTCTASAELSPLEGKSLAPGRYDVELTSASDIAYGRPLVFTVE